MQNDGGTDKGRRSNAEAFRPVPGGKTPSSMEVQIKRVHRGDQRILGLGLGRLQAHGTNHKRMMHNARDALLEDVGQHPK